MISRLENMTTNTNISSVYNYNELSLQQLLSKFYEKINETIYVSNVSIEMSKATKEEMRVFLEETYPELVRWLKEEGISIETQKVINEMYNDGRLGVLINETLLKEINDKVDLVNSELIETVNKINDIAYNIKDFFQVPENDWAKAINRAITKSVNDGNRKVYAPSGNYGLSESIYTNTPIEFYGAGDSTVFYPTRDFTLCKDKINTRLNNEHGALFVFMKDNNSKILSVEKTLDNFSIHDFCVYGDKRKFISDAFHIEYLDHSHFYNLKIEEMNGSVFKCRHIRENNFRDINTRYCGKIHNQDESQYTKGHPAIEILPTDNDTSNINHWVSLNVMCSYYTSMRINRSHNIFTDCYFHSLGTFAENQDHVDSGLPPIPVINGEKCDYDVVQVINTYDNVKIKNFFTSCSMIWGGVTHSQIYTENSTVYLSNVVCSTHWNKVSDNSKGGYGISSKNSLIYSDLIDLENNNIMFKDFGGTTFTFGNFGNINPTNLENTYNEKDWNNGGLQQFLNTVLINVFKWLPFSFKTDGKFIGDKFFHTRFIKSDNTLLSYIGNLSSGKSLIGVKNGMFYLEKLTTPNTDKWNGSMWHDEDGTMKLRDNLGEITIGKTQQFQERSSLPTANESNRGKTFLLQRDNQNDELWICLKKINNDYIWVKISEPI